MIHREDHDRICVLRIEHGKANAIDLDLFTELEKLLEAIEGPSGPGAVVLTGTGSMFSAGVDLFQVLEGGVEYLSRFLPALSQTVRRLFALPIPVVAAINGHAIAGGCILAAACDYRVMTEAKAKIGVSELRVGVPFPVVAFEALRFLLPTYRVQDLVYSGRLLTPTEARDIGLVEELAPAEEVVDRALAAARGLAAIPTEAFAFTKEQLRGPTLTHIDRTAPEIDPRVLESWSRPATLATIQAFLAKTVGKAG